MRIWLFARKGAGWARAIYSVLIDRIAGVFVLALIVIACLPFTFSLIHDPITRAVLLVIGVNHMMTKRFYLRSSSCVEGFSRLTYELFWAATEMVALNSAVLRPHRAIQLSMFKSWIWQNDPLFFYFNGGICGERERLRSR